MGELPPIGNITKWRNSALGKSLHHQMAAFRLLEERKTPEIPSFLLCQTEIKPVLAKSPLKDPSALSSDAKSRQNCVTHGSDCQNRLECPNFRRLTHHAQNRISPIGGIFHKMALKTIGEFSTVGQIPSPHGGQRGASFHQNRTMNPVGQFTLHQNVLQVPLGKRNTPPKC